MQKILAAIGVIIAVGIVGYYVLTYDNTAGVIVPSSNVTVNTNANAIVNSNTEIINTNSTATNQENASAVTLDAQTLSQHASASDCWILISGNVYDVTSYLSTHPGGQGEIIPYCGRDATSAFATKGGRDQSHSSAATTELLQLKVGAFGSNLTTGGDSLSAPQQSVTPTNTTPSPTVVVNTSPPVKTNTNTSSDIALTMNEVRRHASAADCWIVVNNSVYAVSPYLATHPGGSSIIIAQCSRDATQAYTTQGGQGSHSSQATALLAGYRIGSLNETVTVPNPTTPTTNTNTNSVTNGNEESEQEDEEGEDDD